MNWFDKKLQDFRINKAKNFIRKDDVILDIGCYDGTLFKRCKGLLKYGYGIDPTLTATVETDSYKLVPGFFPNDCEKNITYSAITMLAVLEHIPRNEQLGLGENCYKLLASKGRVIITVPSPAVDDILNVMTKLKLSEGMSLEEHYGYDPKETEQLFSKGFKLLHKSTFQFGLNNLFVFEKA